MLGLPHPGSNGLGVPAPSQGPGEIRGILTKLQTEPCLRLFNFLDRPIPFGFALQFKGRKVGFRPLIIDLLQQLVRLSNGRHYLVAPGLEFGGFHLGKVINPRHNFVTHRKSPVVDLGEMPGLQVEE
jgi:hypothetical protein